VLPNSAKSNALLTSTIGLPEYAEIAAVNCTTDCAISNALSLVAPIATKALEASAKNVVACLLVNP